MSKKNQKRVRLPANAAEGWAEEYGTVIGEDTKSRTLTVQLDKQYLDGKCDDGIREVAFKDVEFLD